MKIIIAINYNKINKKIMKFRENSTQKLAYK